MERRTQLTKFGSLFRIYTALCAEHEISMQESGAGLGRPEAML
jgi:hypothetical protein